MRSLLGDANCTSPFHFLHSQSMMEQPDAGGSAHDHKHTANQPGSHAARLTANFRPKHAKVPQRKASTAADDKKNE